MFKTPYETTTLSSFVMLHTKSSLEEIIVNDKEILKPLDTEYNLCNENLLVLNDNEQYKDVPLFTQPLLVNTNPVHNQTDDNRFVVDCRPFTGTNNLGQTDIKKPSQYKNNLIIGGLSHFWYFGGEKELASINKFPVKVFSSWITSALAKRLNVDEIAQVKTNAIIAYYFCCLFEDFEPYGEQKYLDDDHAYVIGIKVAHATSLKVYDAVDLIKQIPTMSNINDLVSALKNHGGTERYKQLNTGFLYTLLGRSSMNGMSSDSIIACLEYPPIFLAMMYIAATERGYNKSDIGGMVYNLRNSEDVKHFCIAIRNILNS